MGINLFEDERVVSHAALSILREMENIVSKIALGEANTRGTLLSPTHILPCSPNKRSGKTWVQGGWYLRSKSTKWT